MGADVRDEVVAWGVALAAIEAVDSFKDEAREPRGMEEKVVAQTDSNRGIFHGMRASSRRNKGVSCHLDHMGIAQHIQPEVPVLPKAAAQGRPHSALGVVLCYTRRMNETSYQLSCCIALACHTTVGTIWSFIRCTRRCIAFFLLITLGSSGQIPLMIRQAFDLLAFLLKIFQPKRRHSRDFRGTRGARGLGGGVI